MNNLAGILNFRQLAALPGPGHFHSVISMLAGDQRGYDTASMDDGWKLPRLWGPGVTSQLPVVMPVDASGDEQCTK